jgi:hypothetical protein
MLTMIFGTSYVAFSCFALGQAPHWRAVVEAKDCSSMTRWLLRHEGLSYGILLWTTSLTITAFCVVATLAFRPRFLRLLAWIAGSMNSRKN